MKVAHSEIEKTITQIKNNQTLLYKRLNAYHGFINETEREIKANEIILMEYEQVLQMIKEK